MVGGTTSLLMVGKGREDDCTFPKGLLLPSALVVTCMCPLPAPRGTAGTIGDMSSLRLDKEGSGGRPGSGKAQTSGDKTLVALRGLTGPF